MRKTELTRLAQKIRKILVAFQGRAPEMNWTPCLRGGCAVGSYMLGEHLRKLGVECSVYESRMKGKLMSHVWLETKSYLIDVTYSQFKKGEIKILIISRSSLEYKTFRNRFLKPEKLGRIRSFNHWHKTEEPKNCIKLMIEKGIVSDDNFYSLYKSPKSIAS